MDGDEGKENDAYEQDLPVVFVPPKNFLSVDKQNGRKNSYFYEPNVPLKANMSKSVWSWGDSLLLEN